MEMRQNPLKLMNKIRTRTFSHLERDLRKNGLNDILPVHGDVLFAVFRHNGIDMQNLAEATGRDKSTLTPLVDHLVNKGYLERRVSANDRRRAEIYLTRKTEKIKPTLIKIGFRMEKKMTRGVPDSEWVKFMETLNHVFQNMDELS